MRLTSHDTDGFGQVCSLRFLKAMYWPKYIADLVW